MKIRFHLFSLNNILGNSEISLSSLNYLVQQYIWVGSVNTFRSPESRGSRPDPANLHIHKTLNVVSRNYFTIAVDEAILNDVCINLSQFHHIFRFDALNLDADL